MDHLITYRGAKANESEVRVDQLEQQQATRTILYRGVTHKVIIGHNHKVRKVTYRGATAEMDV